MNLGKVGLGKQTTRSRIGGLGICKSKIQPPLYSIVNSDTVNAVDHFKNVSHPSRVCNMITFPTIPPSLSSAYSCIDRHYPHIFSDSSKDLGRNEKTVPTTDNVMEMPSRPYMCNLSSGAISGPNSFK